MEVNDYNIPCRQTIQREKGFDVLVDFLEKQPCVESCERFPLFYRKCFPFYKN